MLSSQEERWILDAALDALSAAGLYSFPCVITMVEFSNTFDSSLLVINAKKAVRQDWQMTCLRPPEVVRKPYVAYIYANPSSYDAIFCFIPSSVIFEQIFVTIETWLIHQLTESRQKRVSECHVSQSADRKGWIAMGCFFFPKLCS